MTGDQTINSCTILAIRRCIGVGVDIDVDVDIGISVSVGVDISIGVDVDVDIDIYDSHFELAAVYIPWQFSVTMFIGTLGAAVSVWGLQGIL